MDRSVVVRAAGRRVGRSRGNTDWRRARWAYVFLAPQLLFVLVFSFVPIVAAFVISFTRWSLLQPPAWVGVSNYLQMFKDDLFVRSIGNTLYFLAVITPVRLVLGLAVALLVNQKLRLRNLFRTITFTPWITSGVVVASIWLLLYSPETGVLNYALRLIGLKGLYWLTDPTQSMPSVIIAALWRSVGWVVIIYLAGLQGIPNDFYEAAQIDGAGPRALFRHITLPLLQPTTLLVLITTMIGSFQMFDLVYVMTGGGPLNSTTVMAHQIYLNGFLYLKMGYASAQSFLLFALVVGLSLITFRWLQPSAS